MILAVQVFQHFLCRFSSWSTRASSGPVCRSLLVAITDHFVFGTVAGRTLARHSSECQPFVMFEHSDTSCNQEFSNHTPSSAPVLLSTRASSTRDHPRDSHATRLDGAVLHLDSRQSLHVSLHSNLEAKLIEILAVCSQSHVDLPGYE